MENINSINFDIGEDISQNNSATNIFSFEATDNIISTDTGISVSNSEIDLGVLGDSSSITKTFNGDREGDILKFEIDQAGSFNFSLDDLRADLDLSINDSEGNTLYTSANPNLEAEFISAEFAPGNYVANVTAQEDVSTVEYDLSITQSSTNDSPELGETEEPLLAPGDTVYRFFRSDAQTQFYTTAESERDFVRENLPEYEYEGESFIGAPNLEEEDITGTKPVYRFFNTNTGVHLYTASETEQNFVTENLSNYTSEGIAYYGYETEIAETTALYRFYNLSLDAHFYTPSLEERNRFINSSDYEPEGSDEGIAFYVQSIDLI